MNNAAFALILLVFSATLAADDPSSWSPAQVEVWRTVQARTDAWVANDFEAYLSLHHERWRRFSMITSKLMSKDDVAHFWRATAFPNRPLKQIGRSPQWYRSWR
jgi:hypothetical protein